jgi:hypothetical protein
MASKSLTSQKNIFIDNCVWDFFFSHQYDLVVELPRAEFSLFMTKHVQDFEVEGFSSKTEFYAYYREQIEKREIEKYAFFGYSSYEDLPDKKYKVEGFGFGRGINYGQLNIYARYEHFISGKIKGSGLNHNESDVWLAVHSLTGFIVLTAEKKQKSGPLKQAYQDGGTVIFLEDYDSNKESLREFLIRMSA